MNFVGADGGEGVEPEEVEGTCASQRKIAAKPFARAIGWAGLIGHF